MLGFHIRYELYFIFFLQSQGTYLKAALEAIFDSEATARDIILLLVLDR